MLRVLTGTPLAEAADELAPAELADAVEIYRQAGLDALTRQAATGWWQVHIQFTDWSTAEQTAVDHLAPLLGRAEAWWFIRKHPCWRLRLRAGPTVLDDLRAALDELAANRRIARWWPGIYEAETAAFGGGPAMDIAHDLFCVDSQAILDVLRDGEPVLGRRELSLLLCGALLRAAGLEWYEQGDVWHRVAQERPSPGDVPRSSLTSMADDLKRLLLADTTPDGPLLGATGPLAAVAGWTAAFADAGARLGAAAGGGTLSRGLRDVLSYHVIFHWNRLGLPVRTQSVLALAARTLILGLPGASPDQERRAIAPGIG
ncbi:thiopeptide-type bacteriocin biosynthesis protein [Actinophytocola sediminis]